MRIRHAHITADNGALSMGDLPANSKRRGPRRATNVTLQANLLVEAKQLGINISEACEAGLHERVVQVRRQRWLEENREAIDDYNARIERDGLTLARYRQF
jgi:antitoxin CcdA